MRQAKVWLLVLATVTMSSCGSDSEPNKAVKPTPVHGTILLQQLGHFEIDRQGEGPEGIDGKSCNPYRNPEAKYVDIPGAEVLVRNADGTIIEKAVLAESGIFKIDGDNSGCLYSFDVNVVSAEVIP